MRNNNAIDPYKMRSSGFLTAQYPLGLLAERLLTSLHSTIYCLSSSSSQHLWQPKRLLTLFCFSFLFDPDSLEGLILRTLTEAFPLPP
jgi:hypothetical protein